ncbi:SRPBCC family protein [Planococcus sp. APC 4015]|nr:SRPBCC family protein [Planococcus sp. APC 4015]
MITVTESVSIRRSPEDVFDFLTDGRNRPLWDASVISEELVSPPPFAVGSTVHTRLRAMGREVDFIWRVTRFVRPDVMEVVSRSGPVATSSTFRFTADAAGCRVTATIKAEPTGVMRLVEPVIAEQVRSTLATGLARATSLLEKPPQR